MAIKTYSLPRIAKMYAHVQIARFLSNTSEEPIGYLARGQVEDIPSPYAYSPVKPIYDWNGKPIVWFETAHKTYEVFEVPANMLRFKTDDAATDWHIRFCRKH